MTKFIWRDGPFGGSFADCFRLRLPKIYYFRYKHIHHHPSKPHRLFVRRTPSRLSRHRLTSAYLQINTRAIPLYYTYYSSPNQLLPKQSQKFSTSRWTHRAGVTAGPTTTSGIDNNQWESTTGNSQWNRPTTGVGRNQVSRSGATRSLGITQRRGGGHRASRRKFHQDPRRDAGVMLWIGVTPAKRASRPRNSIRIHGVTLA